MHDLLQRLTYIPNLHNLTIQIVGRMDPIHFTHLLECASIQSIRVEMFTGPVVVNNEIEARSQGIITLASQVEGMAVLLERPHATLTHLHLFANNAVIEELSRLTVRPHLTAILQSW